MNRQSDNPSHSVLLPNDPLVAFCRAFPAATEDVKWEDRLVFSVGGKMFVMFKLPDGETLDFKADPLAFSFLSGQPDFAPAPYLARATWLRLHDRTTVGDATCIQLLRDAYTIVRAKLPKKIKKQIEQTESNGTNRSLDISGS